VKKKQTKTTVKDNLEPLGNTVLDGWMDDWVASLSFDPYKNNPSNPDYYYHNINKRLSQGQLDNIYASDWAAAKGVDKPAGDMLRQGIDIDHTSAKDLYDFYDTWKINNTLSEYLRYDGAYGGSAIIFDVDDGLEDWSQPLNLANVKGVNDIFAIDRFYLMPVHYDLIKTDPKKFNILQKPELFYLNGQGQQTKIHISRMCMATGIDSGHRNRVINCGFGESKIYRALTELNAFGKGHKTIPNILEMILTRIFKLDGMTEKIKAKGENAALIRKKLAFIQATANNKGVLAIDMKDDFVQQLMNLSGLPDAVEMINALLSAAFSMPKTHFLEQGTSTGLSNNGGNSQESKGYNDFVKDGQVQKLQPAINKINQVAQAVNKKLGKKTIKYEFCPLNQPTETEITANRKVAADTKKVYFDMGLPAETILKQTFGQGYYSDEMTLTEEDINLMKKQNEEKKAAAEKALQANKNNLNNPKGEKNGKEKE
jgi:phage-related protein (TIGR01555 family)